MDGWRDRIRSKVRGQDRAWVEGDDVTTNLLQFTDTKEKEEREGKEGVRRRSRRRRGGGGGGVGATPRQPFYFSVVLQQPLLP